MTPRSASPARGQQRQEVLHRLARMGVLVDSLDEISDRALNEVARVVIDLADRARDAGNPVNMTVRERLRIAGAYFDRFKDRLGEDMSRDKFLSAALQQPESALHAMKEALQRVAR
jgi:hypothetical protein